MSALEILALAIALAMDAFAVSLAAAAVGFAEGGRARFRLAFHFGLFQGLMPVLGWALGRTVAARIAAVDHWIAFGLLAFIAWRMIRAGWDPDGETLRRDPSRGMTLVMLSTATSIDALAVGLSLSALQIDVILPSLVIGVVTAALCLVAILGGRRLGRRLGDRAQIAGGVLLLLVALKILIEHLS